VHPTRLVTHEKCPVNIKRGNARHDASSDCRALASDLLDDLTSKNRRQQHQSLEVPSK